MRRHLTTAALAGCLLLGSATGATAGEDATSAGALGDTTTVATADATAVPHGSGRRAPIGLALLGGGALGAFVRWQHRPV